MPHQFNVLAVILSAIVVVTSGCQTTPYVQTSMSPRFQPSSLSRVAVVVSDLSNQSNSRSRNSSSGIVHEVEDAFLHSLVRGGYSVPSRSDVNTVMKELKFQNSDFTDDNAARLGRLLNVEAVIVVTITKNEVESMRTDQGRVYRNNSAVSARLIEVESSEILWLASRDSNRSEGYGFGHWSDDPNIRRGNVSSSAIDVAARFPSKIVVQEVSE